MSNTLWGGRFTESTDEFVQSFTASVRFDQRMAQQDISCSRAHARMLGTVGVLSAQDVNDIL
ncbi:MAG: argininosuccinate lyase, partial [Pseudomonadota bacterium]